MIVAQLRGVKFSQGRYAQPVPDQSEAAKQAVLDVAEWLGFKLENPVHTVDSYLAALAREEGRIFRRATERKEESIPMSMGVVRFETLVEQYKNGSVYARHELIARTLHGYRLGLLRKLVHKAYAGTEHDKQIVLTDHGDVSYLRKLLAWAIVERSGLLDEDHVAALIKNRRQTVAKGPDYKAYPDTSILDLGNNSHQEGRVMETTKKKKSQPAANGTAAESKKKVTAKKAPAESPKQKGYLPTDKFVATAKAKDLTRFSLKSLAAKIFEDETSYASAEKQFQKAKDEKKFPPTDRTVERALRDTVKALLRDGYLKSVGGAAAPAKKKAAGAKTKAAEDAKTGDQAA